MGLECAAGFREKNNALKMLVIFYYLQNVNKVILKHVCIFRMSRMYNTSNLTQYSDDEY